MSDGLKLLVAALEDGSVTPLREIDPSLLVGDESPILDFIRSHYRRHRVLPDISTVESETGTRLPDAVEPYGFYLAKVRDRRLYGQMRNGFNDLKACLREYDMVRAREVLGLLHSATRHADTAQDLLTLDEAAESVLQGYRLAHQNPGIVGVPTGWPLIDGITGGYQESDLITWVGRMGMGKTTLLLKQAWGAWFGGYSVLFVTMEMSVEQITRRMLALPTGIDPRLIRRGTLSVYAERRLNEVIESLTGAARFKMFSGGMKKYVDDIDLLVQEYEPDIVFLDGAYLAKPSNSRRRQASKTEQASDLLDELKQLTLAHHKPLVITSQYNRQAGKKGKDGGLESIAYTDSIGTHSSVIVDIRPHDDGDDKRLLTFIKGREGEKGSVSINYRFSPPDFGECAQEVEVNESRGSAALDWMA